MYQCHYCISASVVWLLVTELFGVEAVRSVLQQVAQNPQLMTNMLQAPYVQTMLQSMSSNPSLVLQVRTAVWHNFWMEPTGALSLSDNWTWDHPDNLSWKPGNVGEFDSCQGNVKDFAEESGKCQGNICQGKVAKQCVWLAEYLHPHYPGIKLILYFDTLLSIPMIWITSATNHEENVSVWRWYREYISHCHLYIS